MFFIKASISADTFEGKTRATKLCESKIDPEADAVRTDDHGIAK